MFDRYRRTHPLILPLPPLILLAVVLLVGKAHPIRWTVAIADRTHWIIRPELVLFLMGLALLLAVILLPGKLKPDDLGLNRDLVARGLGIILMTWMAAQVLAVLPRVVSEDPIAIHQSWLRGDWLRNVVHLLSALTLASITEIALRGFLLVQLYLLLHRDSKDPDRGLGVAVAASVIMGNLAVAAITGVHGTAPEILLPQAVVAADGLLLCWIYLRTRNLFFAIGVQALIIAPTPIVAGIRGEPGWFHSLMIAVVASVWTLLWPRRE
jgi:membrane protease YdiL (CAAX protease family)